MFVHQAGRALGGFDLGVFFWDVQQFLLAFGAESECEKAFKKALLSCFRDFLVVKRKGGRKQAERV